jgi:hypothetical protein
MLRLVLLSLGAALFMIGTPVTNAQAHSVHADCRVGNSWMGVVPHYHPGAYGQAVACGGGGGYGQRPPIVGPGYQGDYYRPGYGGGGGGYGGGYRGRPGDYGPQTNRGQDCYNVYGRRICCPKGWTVQDGQCQPYRGR